MSDTDIQIPFRVKLHAMLIKAIRDISERILNMHHVDTAIRFKESQYAIVFDFWQPVAALDPFAHINSP